MFEIIPQTNLENMFPCVSTKVQHDWTCIDNHWYVLCCVVSIMSGCLLEGGAPSFRSSAVRKPFWAKGAPRWKRKDLFNKIVPTWPESNGTTTIFKETNAALTLTALQTINKIDVNSKAKACPTKLVPCNLSFLSTCTVWKSWQRYLVQLLPFGFGRIWVTQPSLISNKCAAITHRTRTWHIQFSNHFHPFPVCPHMLQSW